ncbi:hypothetical protein DUI87_35287 [Hirundo rustica rustica]|uniref:Uncharacterized protein n=1 Tax=Hirundo rustica rustica TaxID=333673 RepID=A0A3M0IHW2_HIRRU|nr:hypothetical protein DUI87_35287 [Hirundo rustica rustica]
MKVAVLGVVLLFSILLCLPAQSKADMDGSGDAICAGEAGGIAIGDVGTLNPSAEPRPSPLVAITLQGTPVHPRAAHGRTFPRLPMAFPPIPVQPS